MTDKTKIDRLYLDKQSSLSSFEFNEDVASVFDDMISRSVPGYGLMLDCMEDICDRFVRHHSRIYDLGCSLGTFTQKLYRRFQDHPVHLIAVDNSAAMLRRCRERIEIKKSDQLVLETQQADIEQVGIENASVVVLNLTLQFVEPERREQMIKKIFNGMLPGACLILSEKVEFENPEIQAFQQQGHYDFKLRNGYSELEIAQKRNALEQVLVPDREDIHMRRLQSAGFTQCFKWFQCFNFISFIAIK